VLTAAHCLRPELVGLGTQDEVTAATRVHFATVDLRSSLGVIRGATRTIPKPAFSATDLGSHDIGLIRLSQPYTAVAPSPVNLDPSRAPVGVTVTMVGYGATERSAGGTVGVQYSLAGRTSIPCSGIGASDQSLLCFPQADNRGKCQGDSGGPSFAQIDGRAVVVGVTSFGDENCAAYGADTRTDAERPFLLAELPELDRICESDADCGGELCFLRRCIAQPYSEGGLGATCTSAGECDSGTCTPRADGTRCTEACALGEPRGCPDGFACVPALGGGGACWPAVEEAGGCCDASGGAGATSGLTGALVAGMLARRRRRARGGARG
jgi:hypothetical protein